MTLAEMSSVSSRSNHLGKAQVAEAATCSRRTALKFATALALAPLIKVRVAGADPPCARIVSQSDLDALEALLPGKVRLAGHPEYVSLATSWNGRYRAQPIAIVRAHAATDIALALSWARPRGIAVVARSGGHSYIGGSLTDGLVIDVSPMSTVTFDASTERATIGAGARLGPIYASLFCDHGQRTFTSGSCPSVGISGITVGGGYSSQSRLTGLTIDAVRAFEVVLADGSIVRADARSEPDLFWALRGGGGAFGIVGGLEIATRPWLPLSVVTMTWPWSASAQAFSVWSSWIASLPSDVTSSATWTTSGTSATQRFRTQVRTLAGPAAAEALASSLEKAVGATSTRSTSTSAAPDCNESGTGSGLPSRNTSLFGAGPIALTAGQAIKEAFEARLAEPALFQGDSGQVISHAFGGAVSAVAPDATAFAHRNAAFLSQILAGWSANAAAPRVEANIAWVDALRDALQPAYGGAAYLNYPDERIADWRNAYWGGNHVRLAKVKSAYDPDRVIRGKQFL